MKAILLAAGLGTRLRPLTLTTPKCLVPVQGKPLLAWWLEQLSASGITEFIINAHYLHEQVEAFVAESPFAPQITLVYEPELMGTLGSVRNLAHYIGADDCLIAHADNFCLTDWTAFRQAFVQRPEDCQLTLMAFETAHPERCGMLSVNQAGVMQEYIEKPSYAVAQPWANAAIIWASNAALQSMCDLPKSMHDLCGDYLPRCCGIANVYVNRSVMLDIGTPDSLAYANQLELPTQ